VGACSELGFALIGTGFGYRPERRAEQGDVVRTLLPRVRDIRRGGSAAVDLSFVAAGRLDGYYERGLNPWDNSAGTVIVREAGGVVSGLRGEEPDEDMTIAANPLLHEVLRAQIIGALND
jgi:myo-inositol-1(or 4)-monophosphatase